MARLPSETIQLLLREANRAMELAYSPYSMNKVGAALLTDSGKVFVGANIGNSCAALNCCAEQAAIVQAVLSGNVHFSAIAVVRSSGETCVPCGRCLQLLSEFADEMFVFSNQDDQVVEWNLTFLLPVPFRRDESRLTQ
jgi:cytidine deaminase